MTGGAPFLYLTSILASFFSLPSIKADTWGYRPNFQEHTSSTARLYWMASSSDLAQHALQSAWRPLSPNSASSLHDIHERPDSKPSSAHSLSPSGDDGATVDNMPSNTGN